MGAVSESRCFRGVDGSGKEQFARVDTSGGSTSEFLILVDVVAGRLELVSLPQSTVLLNEAGRTRLVIVCKLGVNIQS